MIAPYLEHALLVVVLLSGIPLLLSTSVSLVVSLLQAATQIQEQSIGFLLKIATVTTVLVFAGSTVFEKLVAYFRWTYEALPYLGV